MSGLSFGNSGKGGVMICKGVQMLEDLVSATGVGGVDGICLALLGALGVATGFNLRSFFGGLYLHKIWKVLRVFSHFAE